MKVKNLMKERKKKIEKGQIDKEKLKTITNF